MYIYIYIYIYEGFRTWGYPQMLGLQWKNHQSMDDARGYYPMTYRKAPTVKICHAAHRESQLRWFPGQPGPETPGESGRMG